MQRARLQDSSPVSKPPTEVACVIVPEPSVDERKPLKTGRLPFRITGRMMPRFAVSLSGMAAITAATGVVATGESYFAAGLNIRTIDPLTLCSDVASHVGDASEDNRVF